MPPEITEYIGENVGGNARIFFKSGGEIPSFEKFCKIWQLAPELYRFQSWGIHQTTGHHAIWVRWKEHPKDPKERTQIFKDKLKILFKKCRLKKEKWAEHSR